LLERRTKNLTELRCDIQERRQREATVLELGVRHGKLERLVRAALIPKQVEIDAARAPSFIWNAMSTETTLRSQ
jgi:short-subunit dehydrogenase involved in D-alanine esterification of teichoic acids